MRSVAIALAFLATACGGHAVVTVPDDVQPDGSADAGAIAFPVGTYTNCAQGVQNPDSNAFLNTAGFEVGATLTLEQDGSDLAATYVDQNGLTSAFDFSVTAPTSAALAHGGQTVSGFTSLCVLGVGVSNEAMIPAILTASSGALTYDAGAVFLSLAGTLDSNGDGASCPPLSTPGSFWIVCQDGSPAASVHAAPVSADLPVGAYACRSQIETRFDNNGTTTFAAGGGNDGTLVLTQSGAQATAEYSGDTALAGTLRFDVTTTTTASVQASQSVSALCETLGAPSAGETGSLSVTAGAIAVNGDTLVVSFAGTMNDSSACAGAQKAGSVVCSKP